MSSLLIPIVVFIGVAGLVGGDGAGAGRDRADLIAEHRAGGGRGAAEHDRVAGV